MIWFLLALLSAGVSAQDYPYPNGSSGYADPDARVAKLCTPDYTATIRPKTSYTNRLKKQQMKALGLPGKPKNYEEDHVISLELGGHPTDPRNLSPESYLSHPGAREKDRVEDRLHECLCNGQIDLKSAQRIISQKWEAAYEQIREGLPCPTLGGN